MQSLTRLYNIGQGPSSSHTMGPLNAGRDFLGLFPQGDHYRVTLYGSLAFTGKGHLTDRALLTAFENRRLEIDFDYQTVQPHPNTLIFVAFDENHNVIGEHTYTSIGGGALTRDGRLLADATEYYPFRNFNDIKAYCQKENIDLPTFVRRHEDSSTVNIDTYLRRVWKVMKSAIYRGQNTNGILPGKLKLTRKSPLLSQIPAGGESREDRRDRLIYSYAYAVCEENASGGEIVTAPTCGSSGVLPAALYYYQKRFKYTDAKIIEALMVAGVIGITIKQNGSISGAECGCQAEVGVAGAMAAAALAFLAGLPIGQIEYSAEIVLEHHLGLTCDPVYGYVQIPCIERNGVVAVQASAAVLLARHLSDSHRVSFDQMVLTMVETGRDMHVNYRETSRAGLAKTIV